jgi:hypothetical protein
MSARRTLVSFRSPRSRRTATAALASAGVAAIALSVLPVQADAEQSSVTTGGSAAWDLKAADIPGQPTHAEDGGGSGGLDGARDVAGQRDRAGAEEESRAGAQAPDLSREDAGKREAQRAEEREQAQQEAEEQAQAAEEQQEQQEEPAQPVSRSAAEQPRLTAEQVAAQDEYPYTLDGWIRHALAIMDEHGIPGSYDGLYRNIMRESSGDPNAINLWDINAQNGTPSIGLLQVIQPTYDAYHVPGTIYDIYNPVSNIVAAANYAADRYGSIDNVWGAY